MDSSLIPECTAYLPYSDSILTTPQTPVSVLLVIAQQQLALLAQLPPNCGIPLTEMICHLIFQECVQIPIAPGFDLALPRTPCKETCTRSNDQCAQLFSSVGQFGQDCDALGPTCSPLFVETNTTLTLAPGAPGAPPIVLPCQPSYAPLQDPIFYCEKWKGIPSVCSAYVDEDLSFSIFFDQDSAAAIATQSLSPLAAVPDACRFSAEEFICRNIFRKCNVVDDVALPTKFYYGSAICESGCELFNAQCGELFGLSGSNLTDCAEFSSQLQNLAYPPKYQTFKYNATVINVPCKVSDLTKSQTQPFFGCTKWQGEPKLCKPYLSNDANIFYIDPFQLEARVNLTNTFLSMMQELPKTCRNYANELICRTFLQECESFDDKDLPTTYYVGKPVCKKICEQVRGCTEELYIIGVPPPDCDADDALVSGKLYPTSKNKLLIPGHDYSVSCTRTIYNDKKSGNTENKKRRFVRDIESEEVVLGFDGKEEVEDYESIYTNFALETTTKNIAPWRVDSYLTTKIGIGMDSSIEEMVRDVCEKLVRRIQL